MAACALMCGSGFSGGRVPHNVYRFGNG
jgi:hypothetical protein